MINWTKSSYSAANQNCVEVGRGIGIRDSKAWRKSTYSAANGDCVEIGSRIGIRDSKSTGHLPVTAPAWSAFLSAIKSGSFQCR
jgi:uncharacterized protein DUF397